uniref:NADH-ubiquinone oxidoreductase chain 2 n=1 Tax=Sermylassa halensis TaxID=227849 RepID=A0A343C572_9CUCU|nr:NADH dehydrogenase subunit 2 [Sermylassa halensis]
MLFFNTLIMSSMVSISAYSWFNMWIGLEINLLSFIPLMKSHNNVFPAEATLKYFIIQTLASTMILFAISLSLNSSDYIPSSNNYWFMMILSSALLTKMGAAPFHSWFPEVMEGLNWMNNLILLTWQKLTPMVLIMYNLNASFFLNLIIICCSVISGILGLNQVSLRKIMAYSSINHIAWMLASMLSLKMVWLNYFVIYSIISINIVYILYILNIFNLKQLFMVINSNKLIKLFFIWNFLSLGGLPPFLGFMPKWITINQLVINNYYALSGILIIFTLMTLYFYIRITFSTLTISMQEMIIVPSEVNNFFMISINILTLMGLPLCASLTNFL